MSKNFRINLDLKRPECTPLSGFKQGDNLATINGVVLQDSIPYNLTGLTLRVNFKLPDGTVKYQAATLTNAAAGEFSLVVLSSILAKVGTVFADISVFEDDKKITSSTFKMIVAESVYDNDATIGQEEKDLLQQIIDAEAERVSAEKIRKSNEIVRIENEDVRKANEIVREDNEAKRKTGYSKMDTRIDNIVVGQGSQTEVIDARLDGITNIKYPTLKARLDDTSKQLLDTTLATKVINEQVNILENATDGIIQIESIKGKTLQNLLGKQGTSVFKQTSTPQTIRKFENLNLKSGVQYTIIVSTTDFVGTENLLVVQNPGTKTIANIKNGGLSITTFTAVDSNAVWIYFLSGGSSSCNTKEIILLEGDYTSNAPIYFEGIKSVAEAEGNKIGIMSVGKNLFDKSTINKEVVFTASTGATSSKTDGYTSDFINVLPNSKYTIKHGIGSSSYGHCFYNSSKKFISGVVSSSGMDTQQVITTPENCVYIRLSGLLAKLDTQQLEKSETTTEYKQYIKDKSEILLKEPLRGLPNNVVDEIIGNQLVARVGKRLYQPNDENNPLFITDKIDTYYKLADPITTTLNSTSLKNFKDGSIILNNSITPTVTLKYPTSIVGRLSTIESTLDDTVDRTQKLEEGLFTTVAQTIVNKQDLTTAKVDIGNLKTEVVNARNGKPNLKAEIDGIKQSIIQLSINVKDFGAKGDGTQDDTTLIQKAIDACFNSGGGWVLIPAGTYKTTASIQLKSKVKLIGAGTNSTVIKKSGVYNAINAGKDGDYVNNRADAVGLFHMQIDGANFGGHGVSFTHTHYYNIEDIIIVNNGDRGLSVDYSYTGRIDGVEARRNKTNIWIYNQANAIYCTNLYSSTATEYGFYVGGCLGLFLNGLTHEGTAKTAIKIAGYSIDLTINGVYFESDEKDIQEYLIFAGEATGGAASKNITIENVGTLITNCITGKTLYHVRYSTDCIKFKNIFTKISGGGDASTAAILTGGLNSLTTNPITGLTVENFYVDDVTTSKTSKLIDFSGQVQSGTVKNVYSNKYNPTTSIEIRRQWAAPFGDFTVDCINRKQIFKAGATSNRPALAGVGEQYFDTNLDKIVVYTGSAWV